MTSLTEKTDISGKLVTLRVKMNIPYDSIEKDPEIDEHVKIEICNRLAAGLYDYVTIDKQETVLNDKYVLYVGEIDILKRGEEDE